MHDIVSDLHFDNGMSGGPFGWFAKVNIARWVNQGSSILIISGDTGNYGDDAIDFFNEAANSYEHVIAIFGNHEAHGTKSPSTNVHLLEDGPFRLDDIGFVGGEYCEVTDEDIFAIKKTEDDPAVKRLIILSHFAPDIRVGIPLGIDMSGKSNDLIMRLGPPKKPTTIVFGHAHIPYEGDIGGYHCVSNPRGYRGVRRDGTAFKRFMRLV